MTTRRRFILGTLAASGALVLGWSALPPRQRQQTATPLPAAQGEHPFNGWVKVGEDDRVTVVLARSEMGQGVSTSLALLLADELDADWAQVQVQASPIDGIYNNLATVVDGLPFHPEATGVLVDAARWLTAKTMREIGVMMTGGSSSVKDLWLPMRQAGAAARQMLVETAAARWGVAPADCRAQAGTVVAPDGRTLRYGALAAEAATRSVPSRPRLKTPEQFRLIGKPTPRIDAAAKTDGSARFGIDVQPPDLLHAAIQFCPTRLGRVQACDEAPARALPGVQAVVRLEPMAGGSGGMAVVAGSWWQARQAAEALQVQWDHGPLATFDSDAALAGLSTLLDQDDGFAFHREGDVDAALAGATRRIEAEYRAPWLAHSTLEPMNCTVQLAADGRSATVWAPTQVPGLARRVAAQALGLDSEAVTVHVTLLGGGFGRRLDVDFVAQAATVAKAVPGRPVRTLWTREQDMRHDFYRPACVGRFSAGLDASGRLVAWKNTSAGQAIVPQVLQRVFDLPGGGPDKTTSEGAFDQPYEWPAARIAHVNADLPLPVGFWRAVGHSHQAFFKECFLDEVAHAAGTDPLALRESLLQDHPREREVLQTAARAAGWGTPAPAAPDGAPVARGLALHRSFGSTVAQVAEVSLGPDRSIRVHRVVCAIDCGFAVNPAGVKQQMESAIVFGLSAALHGQVDVRNGQVQPGNFHEQPVLRLPDMPVVEVLVIPSHHAPEGVGEPGLPPLAPAVANALFALTGQRLRSLPLRLA